MSPFQRLRQSCRGGYRVSGEAEAAGAPQGRGPRRGLNRVYLTGVLAADPQLDKGRDGEPVALLLVAFPAPDDSDCAERPETASCEVEVPGQVAEVHSEELRAGGSVFIVGRLSGGGGVIATAVHSGPPPDQGAGASDRPGPNED